MTELLNNNGELIVALMAILLSVWSMIVQRNHNRKTYKPIPVLIKYNYNNRVKILLWNKGNGPLFIVNVKARDKESLIGLMPAETRKYTYVEYVDNLPKRVISPGENLNLLEFKIREDDKGNPLPGYADALKQIKRSLDGVIVFMRYANIYQDEMDFVSQQLDFGNLADENATIEEIEAWKAQKEKERKMVETSIKRPLRQKIYEYLNKLNEKVFN